MPLEAMADLPGLVVRAEGLRSVGLDLLTGLDVRGKAVLVHTGWDRHFGTEAYLHGHPYLEPEAARWLAEAGRRWSGSTR
nr:hypothetical protein GCM10020093_110850 [Planobispora longispora]